ncbi:leucine-rich single-pass membrane protein 2 isoform X3 [Passer montanus]|uniref:leucine-rich single-pass membrane protein 2 isoform X3 n=1 Tax=Passer montanus TaxID=9160 RepID=UPI00196116F0|nr:leucine-rich single-pass membrane protein 2 isoform X3 [Passer montanus]
MPREAAEDSMGRAEGAAPAEPGDPDSSESGAISLRPVESISDLYWASGGHKGTEGNGPAPSSSLHRPPPRPVSPVPAPLLPTLRPVPPASPCPCLGPGHPLLLALLALLALSSLVLATLAIYLSGTWHWQGGEPGNCGGRAARPQHVPVLSPQSCRASRCGRWPSGWRARRTPCSSCGWPAGSSGLASMPVPSLVGTAELPLMPPWALGHHGKGHRRAGGGSGQPDPLRPGSIAPWGTGAIPDPVPGCERKKLGCKDLRPPQ